MPLQLGKSSKTCELRLTARNVAETLDHGVKLTSTEVDFPITKDISFFVEVINATQYQRNDSIEIILKYKLKVRTYENKTLWFKIKMYSVGTGETREMIAISYFDALLDKFYDSKIVESRMPGSTAIFKNYRKLLKPSIIVDNKIDVIINVEEVSAVEEIDIPWIDNEYESHGALSNAYKDDSFKDVKFVIGDETLMAHKAICAAKSRVFHAMFTTDVSDARERQEGVVEIKDTRMVALEAFIKYFYNILHFENCNDELQKELLILADKYDVQDLKKDCEGALSYKLNRENAIDLLITADKHKCENLKKNALKVVRFLLKDCSNFDLVYANTDLVNEVFDEVDELVKELSYKRQRLN